jgi:hypothetical protein
MRGIGKVIGAAVLSIATIAASGPAHAEEKTEPSATGKGVVGGALLGAEAVMLVEAAASVKPPWAYAVGGGLGAVAGGIGGFFAEDAGEAKLSLYMLAGGMALIIPTTVAVLSATSYEPTNYTEDRPPPADEPVAEPPRPAGSSSSRDPAKRAPVAAAPRRVRTTTTLAPRAPTAPALVGVGQGSVALSVPAVVVKPVFTRTEVAMLGVKQQTEVEVPILNVAF